MTWVLAQEELGFSLMYAQIVEFATKILRARGDSVLLGKRWINNFMKQYPEIGTKRSRLMDSKRTNGATTEVIAQWFERLVSPIVQAIKPENRYNMDKAGIIEGIGMNGLIVGSTEKRSI